MAADTETVLPAQPALLSAEPSVPIGHRRHNSADVVLRPAHDAPSAVPTDNPSTSSSPPPVVRSLLAADPVEFRSEPTVAGPPTIAPARTGDAELVGRKAQSGGAADAPVITDVPPAGRAEGPGIVQLDGEAVSHLDTAALSRWVTCLCVVTFDVEMGQAMEYIYPPARLTEAERTSICYLAFPDSNSCGVGDMTFCFRIRGLSAVHGDQTMRDAAGAPRSSDANVLSPGLRRLDESTSIIALSGLSIGEDSGDPAAPGANARPEDASGRDGAGGAGAEHQQHYFYGYVFFRQAKDALQKRGYFQKSVVLIAPHAYIGLYSRLVEMIAPEFFTNGRPLLEAACQNIAQWPAPVDGLSCELPILGDVLPVRLPVPFEGPADGPWSEADTGVRAPAASPGALAAPEHYISASVYEADLLQCFQPFLTNLFLLWEQVLTGQPIVVMGTSPAVSSQTVLALVSLIAPLRLACDYRPYFTIHDSDFKEYTTRARSPPRCILGVTNPYFARALQHWPTHLWVGDIADQAQGATGRGQAITARKRIEWRQRLETKQKPFLDYDKTLLKSRAARSADPQDWREANRQLRRCLYELSSAFMAPLESYFASLVPPPSRISPWGRAPRVQPFDRKAFMEFVVGQLDTLRSASGVAHRGDWYGLYAMFLRSPNFVGWYRQRHRQATERLRRLYLEQLCACDVVQVRAPASARASSARR